MVCVPCFVIPALLFIFRVIIQPLVYRFWGRRMPEPALTCPMPQKKKIMNKSDEAIAEGSSKELDIGAGEVNKKCD